MLLAIPPISPVILLPIALVQSIVALAIAIDKGREPAAWVLFTLVIPVVGLPMICALPSLATTWPRR